VGLVLRTAPAGLEVAAISGIESVLVERGAFGGFGASFERLAFTQA